MSAEPTPITGEERRARRALAAAELAARGLDALLVEPGATMTWLAGLDWHLSERLFAFVVLADGSHFTLAPGFEESRARELLDAPPDGPGGAVVAWQEDEYAFAPLAAALVERRVERIALDPRVRLFARDGLAAQLGEARVTSGAAVVAALRGRKDAHELALLRRAQELTQRALADCAPRIEPG